MSERLAAFFLALGVFVLLEGLALIVGLWEIQKVLQQIAKVLAKARGESQ